VTPIRFENEDELKPFNNLNELILFVKNLSKKEKDYSK
jgi:hypothetical protein